jgi:methyl-accepting chemotaxis protein
LPDPRIAAGGRVAPLQASAREAVAQAEQTNATVEILDQTASRIGEVVKMINAIAGRPTFSR